MSLAGEEARPAIEGAGLVPARPPSERADTTGAAAGRAPASTSRARDSRAHAGRASDPPAAAALGFTTPTVIANCDNEGSKLMDIWQLCGRKSWTYEDSIGETESHQNSAIPARQSDCFQRADRSQTGGEGFALPPRLVAIQREVTPTSVTRGGFASTRWRVCRGRGARAPQLTTATYSGGATLGAARARVLAGARR